MTRLKKDKSVMRIDYNNIEFYMNNSNTDT